MLPTSLEGLIALGAVIGLVMGWFTKNPKMGVAVLLLFALGSCAVAVAEFKLSYADNASSTASLVIVIIPVCLCLGAIGGWSAGFYLHRLLGR